MASFEDFMIEAANMAKMGLWLGPVLGIFQMPLGQVAGKLGSRFEAAFSRHEIPNMLKALVTRNPAALAEKNLLALTGRTSTGILSGSINKFQGALFISSTLALVEEGAFQLLNTFMDEESATAWAGQIAFLSLFFLPSPKPVSVDAKTARNIAETAAKQTIETKSGKRSALEVILETARSGKVDAQTRRTIETRLKELGGSGEVQLRDILTPENMSQFKGYERASVRDVAKSIERAIISEGSNANLIAKPGEAKTLGEIEGLRFNGKELSEGLKTLEVSRFQAEAVVSLAKTVGKLELLARGKNADGIELPMEIRSSAKKLAVDKLVSRMTVDQLIDVYVKGEKVTIDKVSISRAIVKKAAAEAVELRIAAGDKVFLEKMEAAAKSQLKNLRNSDGAITADTITKVLNARDGSAVRSSGKVEITKEVRVTRTIKEALEGYSKKSIELLDARLRQGLEKIEGDHIDIKVGKETVRFSSETAEARRVENMGRVKEAVTGSKGKLLYLRESVKTPSAVETSRIRLKSITDKKGLEKDIDTAITELEATYKTLVEMAKKIRSNSRVETREKLAEAYREYSEAFNRYNKYEKTFKDAPLKGSIPKELKTLFDKVNNTDFIDPYIKTTVRGEGKFSAALSEAKVNTELGNINKLGDSVREKFNTEFDKLIEEALKKGGEISESLLGKMSEFYGKKNLKDLSLTEEVTFMKLLAERLFEKTRGQTMDTKKLGDQIRMVLRMANGEVTEVPAGAGKTSAYLMLAGVRAIEMAKTGEKLNGELVVSAAREIQKFFSSGDSYNAYMKLLGIELVNGEMSEAKRNTKLNEIAESMIAGETHKLVIYELDTLGSIAREMSKSGKLGQRLAEARKKMNTTLIDEADVGALQTKMYIEGAS
ncbi:hypothetical protein ACFLR5_02295, partial [Elusimicrobiota bacterium]